MSRPDLPWVTRSTGFRVREAARLGRLTTLLVAGVVVAAGATTDVGTATHAAARPAKAGVNGVPTQAAGPMTRAGQTFGTMPVAFVANRGQTDPRVRYSAVGHGSAFSAPRHELMLSLSRNKPAR